MFSGTDAFIVNLKAKFFHVSHIKRQQGKKKKLTLGWSHVPFFLRMWLTLWGEKKKKFGKESKSEREEEQRTRGEDQRPKAQTREDKNSTGREERMLLKGQKETDTTTKEKKGSVRRQRM